jgi:prepilin-type N-terminal cleavage/methylation domain-containing protein
MLNTREEAVAGNTKQDTKMNPMMAAARNGFTLVELIVVVAILAILAGITAYRLTGFQEKARETVCVTNRHQQARLSLLDEVNGTPEAGSETEINGAIAPDAVPDQFEGICPGGGVISIVNGLFLCSIHPDEAISIKDEDGDETEPTPGVPEESGVPDEPGEPEGPGNPVPYL